MIKLKILVWEDEPGLFEPRVITGALIRRKQEGQGPKRRCDEGNRGWSDE